MRSATILLLIGGLLFAAPVAAKSEDPPLVRSGKWLVTNENDTCLLVGAFGEGDQQIILRFERYQPSDEFDLVVYGRPFLTDQNFTTIRVDFGPDVNPRPMRAIHGRSGASGMAMLGKIRLDDRDPQDEMRTGTAFPAITPEQEAAVDRVTLRTQGGRTIPIQLGPMRATMKALRDCTSALVGSWGLDPAQQLSLSRPATPLSDPGNWLRPGDYPRGMLGNGAMGIVHFRLDIDEKGAVTGCHLQQVTEPRGFAETTCRLINARARLSPALDAQGKPVRSYYTSAVKWVLGNY